MTVKQRKEAPVATRLLLLEDVEGLGRKGEIVIAKAGFSRNFIVPKGKGVVADRNAMRMQARLQEERAKQAVEDREMSEAIAGQLHGLTISTHVKVDPDYHMYGSVASADVVEILSGAGIKVEKKFIQLPHGIKEIGLHTIDVKLKEGVTAVFKLKVLPEGMDELPEIKPKEVREVAPQAESEPEAQAEGEDAAAPDAEAGESDA